MADTKSGNDYAIIQSVIRSGGTCAGCGEGSCYSGYHCPCEGCDCDTETGTPKTQVDSTVNPCGHAERRWGSGCDPAAIEAVASTFQPERGEDGYLALPCGSVFLNFEEWNREHRPACAICLGNFGPTPEPEHDRIGCLDWCNHCSVCGTDILYGSLCTAHYNVTLNSLASAGLISRDTETGTKP